MLARGELLTNDVESGAYLVHAGVGEEQGGVVDGHDGGGREGGVAPLRLEVLDERLPHLQDGLLSLIGVASCCC